MDKRNTSDDEFHDAQSEATAASKSEQNTSGQSIEELVQQQNDLKLTDDHEEEEEATAGAHKAAANDEVGEPRVIDDSIDEEALREHEKTLSETELHSRKENADRMKLEGNELFKQDEALRAVEVYTEALKICPTTSNKERAILYGNRAAAKIKLDARNSAIDDCSMAIVLWPEYMRAIVRRAKLYELEDKLEDALVDYKRILELDPGQSEARAAVVRLPPIINERAERMKEEMMGKLKDLGNMILKPFGLSTSNFQMQQDPSTGSYSVNFNQKQS